MDIDAGAEAGLDRVGAGELGVPAVVELAEGVVAFSIEAWEPKDREWRAEWNSNGADRTGGVLVPPRVRLILTVRDEEGKEKTYTTQAKVFLTQPLDF